MNHRRTWSILAVVLVTLALALIDIPIRAIWPPVAALVVIIVTRHALIGLLAGGFTGAILLTGGNPLTAFFDLFASHLWPSLQSSWKIGAIAFTLILGGFAAILEAGGGFAGLMRKVAGLDRESSRDASRNLEGGAAGLGILCFFDGLANSMVVGRVSRDLADRSGVARVKLAYIVDSTSSAVACLAFVSTWIAFQLSMISEAYVQAGRPRQSLRGVPGIPALQLLLLVHPGSVVRINPPEIPSRPHGPVRGGSLSGRKSGGYHGARTTDGGQ